MYNLQGPETCLRNLVLLVRALEPDYAICDLASLRVGFTRYLRYMQPKVPLHDLEDLVVTDEPVLCNQLFQLFQYDGDGRVMDDEDLAAMRLEEQAVPIDRLQRIRAAWAALQRYDPDVARLLNVLLRTVFCYLGDQGTGAGTSVNALGTIWTYPSAQWEERDLVEMILHESTHNLIFISERITTLYSDYSVLSDPLNRPISAIRKVPRRLDLVVDSLIVAVEILHYRSRFGWHDWQPVLHPSSISLVQSARDTLLSIRALPAWPSLFSPAGYALFERCDADLRAFDSEIQSLLRRAS